MDLDQLHTFLEIVRLKSFSKAAQSCFRTQPAVSAQVRQLETELNASLFERLGTKIALTPAGHIFADYSEQILRLRREAQDTINELERVPRGELLIAANEATCIYVLPLVFSEYKKQFPNVQMQVDRSYGARVVEAVLDSQADFGITQLPIEEKRLQVVKIHSDEIRALIPTGHPLADRKQILPEDLVPFPLLMPKTGTTRRRLSVWLANVEDDLNVSMELDSTEMIKRFVAAGLGISFLAATHCADEVKTGTLAAVSLGPEIMVRQLALIYRKDKALSKAALGFIEVTLKNSAIDGIAATRIPGVALGPFLWNDRGMQRVTLKTSTIFISKGAQTRVYHSVAEIPQDLRQQLEECTNGFNSATILIADRRGREEIRRALNGMPSTLRTRLSSSLNSDTTSSDATEQPSASPEVASLSAPAAASSFLASLGTLFRRRWIMVAIPVAALLGLAWEQFH